MQPISLTILSLTMLESLVIATATACCATQYDYAYLPAGRVSAMSENKSAAELLSHLTPKLV